jgi:hypothetical protein
LENRPKFLAADFANWRGLFLKSAEIRAICGEILFNKNLPCQKLGDQIHQT